MKKFLLLGAFLLCVAQAPSPPTPYNQGNVPGGFPTLQDPPKTMSSNMVNAVAPNPVNVALTSAGYTVVNNYNIIRLKPTAPVTATVTLPVSVPIDGQSLRLVNSSANAVTLSLSPAIPGWTNGAVLAAYGGITLRWDVSMLSWQRD